ncbi:MAG TPA: glycosyltransferase [Mucilaginibacter sp.]|jgi:glycosyltransferase involved in cell wall biosynthesis|nr:glycosyltransferase [Mucilaginibacter sp.]
MSYTLTYIIATRNRLPFLKITLEKLLIELRANEEIVVVDGNSTDGSKEYLRALFEEGKINQFLSEPDKNQAHAWNKAMLMANGTIIKKIIDDDVFCYKAIQECKNYMLQHPTIDVMISNDLGSALSDHKNIQKLSRLPQFEKWSKGSARSFTFGDVNMLIRKNSLAYIGLYNTAYIMMDWEYSLRISYLKANIAYYTGYNALSIAHQETISSLKNDKLTDEQGKRGCVFYEYEGDSAEISLWSKIKIQAGKRLKPVKSNISAKDNPLEEISSIYNYYYDFISELNQTAGFSFIECTHK